MTARSDHRRPPERHNSETNSFAWLSCAVVVLGLFCLNACESDEPAWVGKVEHAHALADAAQEPIARERAREALEDAYRAVPVSEQRTTVWVKQDLAVRLGEAALGASRFEAAVGWADRGLALSDELNVARADLFRVRGEAFERLGRKDEAISAFHEALKVNQALMERALRGKTEQNHE